MSDEILALTMPKWGLTMTQGLLTDWLVAEGDLIAEGDEVVEVDTEKATQGVESQVAGVLRRRVAQEGDTVAVGGVIGVVAPIHVPDPDIDAFVAQLSASAARDAVTAGPTSETVEGPRGPLHVLVDGQGEEAVMFLHGFGGDAQNWRFVLEPLSSTRRTVAVDLPGHGNSTKDVGSGHVDEFVEAVLAVLEARPERPVHLVGHSFGGLVAAKLVLSRPESVRSLTLIAPAGLGDTINQSYLDDFIAADSRQELKSVLGALFAPGFRVSRQLVDDVLRYKRLEGVPEALAAIRDNAFPDGRQREETWQALEDLTLPILVVWGQDDSILEAGHMANSPSHATMELLEGVGHSPHVEAANRFARILQAFLDS